MRPTAEYAQVMLLLERGVSWSAASERTGVPAGTIRNWATGRTDGRRHREEFDPAPLPLREYAYLLGVYLGDGHIHVMARTALLRISQDSRYPRIIAEIEGAFGAVMPGHRVAVWERAGCSEIQCYSKWWPAIFPQHGAGRKHERAIELEPWQREITHAQPEAFVRGLIHSDGCRIVARQVVKGRAYHYVRYFFSNRSEDIKRICCEHLDLIGVDWNRPNDMDIQVSRASSVAKLERFVGPKA